MVHLLLPEIVLLLFIIMDYKDLEERQVLKCSKDYSLPIIAIPETSGLYFEDSKIISIGYEKCLLFKDNNKLIFD